jgi:DNA-binding IclR family transcriptional regulator
MKKARKNQSLGSRSARGSQGAHQNIARAVLVLSELAAAAQEGLRLSDVMRVTRLSNATVHRLLEGLVMHGLADFREDVGRYFLGMTIFSWSKAASNRFGLGERAGAALQRLADKSQDTAYFMLRVDHQALCLDCREGSFPIKTLTVRIGNRWPLGSGAGGLALLAFLPDEDASRILSEHLEERQRFGINEAILKKEIATAKKLGYALVEGSIISGMTAVAVPIFGADNKPLASISIAAISKRLSGSRRDEIVKALFDEAKVIEHSILGNS